MCIGALRHHGFRVDALFAPVGTGVRDHRVLLRATCALSLNPTTVIPIPFFLFQIPTATTFRTHGVSILLPFVVVVCAWRIPKLRLQTDNYHCA